MALQNAAEKSARRLREKSVHPRCVSPMTPINTVWRIVAREHRNQLPCGSESCLGQRLHVVGHGRVLGQPAATKANSPFLERDFDDLPRTITPVGGNAWLDV